MAKSIDAKLYYERNGRPVNFQDQPVFPRSDTIILTGNVTGDDLTGLAVSLTGRMVLEDGSVGPAVITKTSGVSGGITITNVNPAVKSVKAYIESGDTSGFGPGQVFVFDVEFTTTTTPPLVHTIKGRFAIEEDYTLN
jgi:hypothetical protein